jgi:AraC-like DNA-binding protein
MNFTDLEYISIDNQTTNFPKHFHETFCISLIHQGTEQINFEHQSLFSEAGSISITNPFEVHSNPVIDINFPLKFDTIYISSDLMKAVLDGKNIIFLNRKINSKKANLLFLEVKEAIDERNAVIIEDSLRRFLEFLKAYSEENEKEYCALNFDSFSEINTYIENHICSKFCLDNLAEMANINKFGFVKKFKTSTGMTPMNYILMKKIFSSKKLIGSNSELTDIAYQYNFTDLAHFSKTFKRFIGVSPNKYKGSLTPKN